MHTQIQRPAILRATERPLVAHHGLEDEANNRGGHHWGQSVQPVQGPTNQPLEAGPLAAFAAGGLVRRRRVFCRHFRRLSATGRQTAVSSD